MTPFDIAILIFALIGVVLTIFVLYGLVTDGVQLAVSAVQRRGKKRRSQERRRAYLNGVQDGRDEARREFEGVES